MLRDLIQQLDNQSNTARRVLIEEQLTAGREFMKEYRDTFKVLAK